MLSFQRATRNPADKSITLHEIRPSLTSLAKKAPIVDYLGTCRFHLNCKTALRVHRHLKKKPIKAKINGCVRGHTHMCMVSTLLYSDYSSAISIASRLALAAKLLLQTITKELTPQCATRRRFCEICSLWHTHNSSSIVA